MKALLLGLLGLSASLAALAEHRVTPQAGQLSLPLSAQTSLGISWTEPFVLGVAAKPEGWGYFQFPTIVRAADGELFAKWAMHPDSVKAYGKHHNVWLSSTDRGRTWRATPIERVEPALGVALPNGDRLEIHTPVPADVTKLQLPPVVGSTIENYTKQVRNFYRHEQLPAASQGVYLRRLARGVSQWTIEHAELIDPGALRYTLEGLLPIVWWGDIRVAADGSLYAGVYPGYYLNADGTANTQMAASIFHSTDQGRSWQITGRIPYEPDVNLDPKGAQRSGFTEPAFEILADGSFLCILRTTDGVGDGPMYASRSSDHGKTWSKPEVIAPAGVLPKLLSLKNGTVVLAAGRPGVQLRFNVDAACHRWTPPLELLPPVQGKGQISCGYTGMVALGPDRFLLIYSDFKHPNADNEPRKAIKVREFTVTRKTTSP